jgi:hypothetical protein
MAIDTDIINKKYNRKNISHRLKIRAIKKIKGYLKFLR